LARKKKTKKVRKRQTERQKSKLDTVQLQRENFAFNRLALDLPATCCASMRKEEEEGEEEAATAAQSTSASSQVSRRS